MSWTSAEVLGALAEAAGWLLVPGLIACFALGLRGFLAWAAAPTVSTLSIAVAALIAGALGLAWTPWLAAGLVAVPAAAIVLIRLVSRRGVGRSVPADPRPVQRAAWGGLVPAVAIGSAIVVRGFKTPDALSQTYDAVFHYSALRSILDSGSASALTLGALGGRSPQAFYPAAWHDLASLVVLGGGAPIVIAANLTAGVIAVVGWSLACVFLVRQVFGPSVRALAVTGVVSAGFTAFPWGLLGFGVLWPNELGLALVPVGLGAGLSLLRQACDDALARGPAWFLLVAATLGTGLAQPDTTFSLAALLAFPCCHALLRWIREQQRADRSVRGILGVGGVVLLGVVAWSWVNSLPMIVEVKSFGWAAYETTASAVGEVLLNAPDGRASLWLLSAAVLAGAVVTFRSGPWLPLAHIMVAGLFVLCAAIQSPITRTFTGFWFNDSHRLAAMLPITGVPLAVGGLTWAASALRKRVHRPGTRLVSVTACTALLGGVLFVDTAVRTQQKAAHAIRESYPALTRTSSVLIDAPEVAFFARIRHLIPRGAVVASNPWNGSALIWALDNVRVLFPQLNETTWTEDQRYLALHYNHAATDPAVCRIARAGNVRYLLVGRSRFWTEDERVRHYPGLGDPVGPHGFRLVERQGSWRLYRLIACPQLSGS